MRITTHPDRTIRCTTPHSFRVDVNTQTLVQTAAVPAWLASRTGAGKHRTAVWRWQVHGVVAACGHRVRLPTVRIGGITYTSEEAIAWWTAALTASGQEPRHG
jgi:hypothetical protein